MPQPPDSEELDAAAETAAGEDRPDDQPNRQDQQPERADPDRADAPQRGDPLSGPSLAYSASQQREALREMSDKELLWALRKDDEDALDELIGRKTGPLVHLAARIVGDAEEARDIVQVTFFRLWEHRQRFDDRWSPNTWIYRICSNLAIDHLRARRSREKKTEPVRLHLRDIAATGHRHDLARLHEGEVASIFHELAADLTEKQRLVFLLRELEEMSSKDVAEIVGCRESTVRNHLFNARKLLRVKLLERYPEYARHHQEEGPTS